jgi:hypothetical protein
MAPANRMLLTGGVIAADVELTDGGRLLWFGVTRHPPAIDLNSDKPNAPIPTPAGPTWDQIDGRYLYDTPSEGPCACRAAMC